MSAAAWRVIVATDVVDSTALGALASEGAGAWTAHDRVARDLIRHHAGWEIGRTDGVIALFTDADAALSFADAYHGALAALPQPMQARIGIHGGPVMLRRNAAEDVAQGAVHYEADGPVLPVAVRLQALALPGQTLVSAEARHAAAPDRPVVCHGHWRLKGVDAPLEIFEPLRAGGSARRPLDVAKAFQVEKVEGLWRPVSVGRARLPRSHGVFVGRDDTIAEISSRFDAGAQLVTLLGPGGVGKTRLALEFVQRGPQYFEGGVWFCDLTSATDADSVLQAVALGLDVPLAGRDALRTLGQAIAARGRCLLLLDNAEAVIPAMNELLPAWQQHARDACILATSRVLLGLPGESLVPVSPLPMADACALFDARARDAGTPLTAADQAALPPLADALDRLPLALELAATRVAALPPAQQLARMDSRRRWLASAPGHPRPARHGTLSAVFAASWELLETQAQQVLAQLTVFSGGFDLAAAEAVVEADGGWVGDVLATLMAQSLLPPARDQRHALLRTVHEETIATVTPSSALAAVVDAARRRHARHFAALGETQALAGGFADLENLVAACDAACATDDGPTATRALTLCAEVLLVRGPARRLLALAERVAGLDGLADEDRAEVLRVRGNALYQLGRAGEALADYERGREHAAQARHLERQLRLACAVAVPWTRAGRSGDAMRLLDELAGAAAQLGDPTRQCTFVNTRGSVLLAMQQFTPAFACFEQALALARLAQHPRWEGGAHGNLGTVLYLQGRQREALHHFDTAHRLACQTRDRAWAANAQSNRGLLLMELGDVEQAQVALDDALETARDIGQATLEATAGCNLGLLLLDRGRPAEAVGRLRDAATLADRLGDHGLAAQCERALARALGEVCDRPAALAAVARALAAASTVGDATEQTRCHLAAAQLHAADHDIDAARAALVAARATSAELPPEVQGSLEVELSAAERALVSWPR